MRVRGRPRRKRTVRQRLARLAITLACFYAALLVFALAAQRRLIYPGWWMLPPVAPPTLVANVETLRRDVGDGGAVEAYFVVPGAPRAAAPLLVIFHGNAESIDDGLSEALVLAEQGYAVLLPEYRGYGRSGGAPGMRAIREDSSFFLERARSDARVDGSKTVYIGRSLGGAVAADLALLAPPDALVLESTFTTLSEMFARAGLPPFVVRHPYRPIDTVRSFRGQVMLVHGTRDSVIPVRLGRALHAARADAVYHEPDAGHYPSVEWPGYDAALRAFLRHAGIEPASSPESAATDPE